MNNKDHLETHHLRGLLGFELDSIDHDQSYNPMHIHRHDYWEIFVFNKGEGTHYIGFEEYNFHAKSIHFIQPYQTHLLKRDPCSNGLVIMFDNEYFLQSDMNKQLSNNLNQLKLGNISPIINLEGQDFDNLWNIIGIMKNDISKQDMYSKITFSNYLNIVFCHCVKHFNSIEFQSKHHYVELYHSFINLVINEDIQDKKVEDYAQKLSCSPKQLRSSCLHCSGMTPIDIIHDSLIHKAKKMLIFDQKSITDVAYELNFTDISHFTHFFKKKTGVLPSKFKN
jgi:AraC family transcriptional activator of pobA